jgi:hypothetical protein
MNLVLIETSGNQRYIFATNKLRENVGASELTYQIGTTAIQEAINHVENRGFSVEGILDEPEIGTKVNGQKTQTEVIIATSGKALILTSDETIAKKIVRFVTQKALIEMPGLTVHGAICEVADQGSAESLQEAVGDVHKRLEEIRYKLPSNLQRFQRLPFVAECASSNLPAEKLYVHETVKTREEERPHSLVSITKQDKSREGRTRLENAVRKIERDLHFAKTTNDLDERFADTKWFAVIHADGNGLGQIFINFKKEVRATTGREYIERYRNFSLGLDECTIEAAAIALKTLQTAYRANRKNKAKDSIEVPAVPIVLGGDDLTVICDGQYAIRFTNDFLTKFVEQTKVNDKIREVFPNGVELGICAGIAIIKPHFPFHQAYSLAEELLQSAKKTKKLSRSLSALDYHVLYDSSGTTLEAIREKTPFVARPYIVTAKDTAKSHATDSTDQAWIENHHFDELVKRVKAMSEKDEDDKNKLPNSQLHTLREGLYLERNEAEGRASLIKHRYEEKGFNDLLCNGKLFFEDTFDGKTNNVTHFLDALDVVEFWK